MADTEIKKEREPQNIPLEKRVSLSVWGMDMDELLEYDPEKIEDEFVNGKKMFIDVSRYRKL